MVLVAAYVLYMLLLLATCVFAIWKGGRDERAAATALIVAALASQVAGLLGPRWRGPDFGLLAVDIVFFVALLVIAHRSRRFWPLWAAAAQLVGTLTHFVAVLEPLIDAQAYATAQPFWALPILASIAIGTWGEMRRRQAGSNPPRI